MRKSWLFLTLVLLHLAPVTAHALCPPGASPSECSCVGPPSRMPQLGPAPPIAVVAPAHEPDPGWEASRLYGAALLGLSTIVGAGFWNARKR